MSLVPKFRASRVAAIVSTLRLFATARAGSIATTFAIGSIPIILGMGAAVDYSLALRSKSNLDEIADASALYAVNKAAMSWSAATAKTNAETYFKAQAAALKRGTVASVTATITDSTSGRTAVVAYTASVPTTVAAITGYSAIKVSGTSTANSALPTYIDFYLLLDNTPSMGVAATPNDVSKMVNNTSDQCAFACHDVSANGNDYYALAKSLGVTLRIDVVRQAVQNLMDTASSTEIVSNQFRAAVYTFGSKAESTGLTKIAALSSSLSSVKSQASAIDLMTIPYQNYNSDQLTDFDSVLQSMNSEIPSPGDGSTSSKPQKVLFFVSDGVADFASNSCSQPTNNGRCQQPINVQKCTTIKNTGVKIAVLYTTYLALPTNSWYMTWIDPFNAGPYGPSPNSQIAKNMQACASPGYYFEVSPTDGISDAMTALFKKAVQAARLTK